MEGNQPAD